MAILFASGALFNTASNWGTTSGASDGTVPGSSDIATFDSNSINMALDVNADISGLNLVAGNTSTLDFDTFDMQIRTGDWNQVAGTVLAGSGTILLNGADMNITGGTFTEETSRIKTNSTCTINLGSQEAFEVEYASGGSDVNVTGTLVCNGDFILTSVQRPLGGTIDCKANMDTNDIDLGTSGTTNWKFTGTAVQRLFSTSGAGAIADIEIDKSGGSFTIEDTIHFGGVATVYKVTNGSVLYDPGADIIIDGRGITFEDTWSDFTVPVEVNISGSFTVTVLGTLRCTENLTLTQYNRLNSGTLEVEKDVTVLEDNPNLNHSTRIKFVGSNNQLLSAGGGTGALPGIEIAKSGGTLTVQDTIEIAGTVTVGGGEEFLWTSGDVDFGTSKIIFESKSAAVVPGALLLFDVELDMGNFALTLTGTLNVTNQLTLTSASSMNGGTVKVGGKLVLSDSSINGTTQVELNGTEDQDIETGGTGEIANGTFTINKASGIAKLTTGALDLDGSGQDMTITLGEFCTNGNDLTVADVLTIDGAAQLTRVTGDTVTADSTVGDITDQAMCGIVAPESMPLRHEEIELLQRTIM